MTKCTDTADASSATAAKDSSTPFPPLFAASVEPEPGVRDAIRHLHPAYFALVMATATLGTDASLAGLEQFSFWLMVVAFVAAGVLTVFTLARLLLFPSELRNDLFDYTRGPGFFTLVAAIAILGVQLALRGAYAPAKVLWVVTLPLWAVCMYSILTAFTIREEKPSLAEGIHGGWLIAVVATQAVANLGCLVAPAWPDGRETLLFFSLTLWLSGGMLYIWMISLIFYRYTFFRFSPADLMPPYWINMGAMAISALAGTNLLHQTVRSPLLERLEPFLLGFTLFFWATATWWIPMLFILAVWRHVIKRFELAYSPLYWGAVFPLAMYALCNYRLAEYLQLTVLDWLGRTFFVLAIAAWSLTSLGMVRALLRGFVLSGFDRPRVSTALVPQEHSFMTPTSSAPRPAGNPLQLGLATGAFAVCFAVFGSVSAMMPIMRKQLQLTPLEVSIALAVPILLGSLGRIPLGMLTDRFGGRLIFSLVMAFSIVPAMVIGHVSSFPALVICGFFIGIALASFSVGVGFASGWYPPEKQGTALGIYGAGNIGQSLAAFGSPVLAAAAGYVWGFRTFGVILAVWLALWLLLARNAPVAAVQKPLREIFRPLADRRSWQLSLYYFLSFGGFVAMAVYLPVFLTETFQLTPRDAGFRTAGFIVLATAMRPIGGWLSDRIGGRAVLTVVFPWVTIMGTLLTFQHMVPFTVGALGMAAGIGLGNGAVFKLVPEYFPKSVGAVTGLVGAAGGLGGFFPPLLLGAVRQTTGDYTYGFVLLSIFSLICLVVIRPKVLALCLVPPEDGTRDELCSRAPFCIYADTCLKPEARSKATAMAQGG
jgi:NNP family nitrate/nitrite transporter-like MFS transporter